MKTIYPENWPQFFTATIHEWKQLFSDDRYKNIIIDCLKFLVDTGKIKLHAFVIMNNHIHVIWQATGKNKPADIQTSFKKFTSGQFLKLLIQDKIINSYQVNSVDRKHLFWKRNSLAIELFTEKTFQQKLEYIHDNPVKAGLCKYPEDYKYSSAAFYEKQVDVFGLFN